MHASRVPYTAGKSEKYEQSTDAIIDKLNRDMDKALSLKDMSKRDTLILESLRKHYRRQINRRADYANLCGEAEEEKVQVAG